MNPSGYEREWDGCNKNGIFISKVVIVLVSAFFSAISAVGFGLQGFMIAWSSGNGSISRVHLLFESKIT